MHWPHLELAVQTLLKVGFDSLVFIWSTKLWTTTGMMTWNHMQRGGNRQIDPIPTNWHIGVVRKTCILLLPKWQRSISLFALLTTPSERCFSHPKLFVPHLRNKLNPQSLKEACFLPLGKWFLKTRNGYNKPFGNYKMIGISFNSAHASLQMGKFLRKKKKSSGPLRRDKKHIFFSTSSPSNSHWSPLGRNKYDREMIFVRQTDFVAPSPKNRLYLSQNKSKHSIHASQKHSTFSPLISAFCAVYDVQECPMLMIEA
jgi:hypothetical protein